MEQGKLCLIIWCLVSCTPFDTRGQKITDENQAIQFLREVSDQAEIVRYHSVMANWIYNTNITDYNEQKMLEASSVLAEFDKEARHNASLFDISGFDEDTIRQFEFLLYIGSAALSSEDKLEYDTIISKMKRTYSTAKVCGRPGHNPSECFSLEPDLTRILADSRDYDELLWCWEGWRDEAGKPTRDDYTQFVELANKAAKANDEKFDDFGDYLRYSYDVDDLQADVLRLYAQLEPLYKKLHAYVRRRLYQHYGDDKIDVKGPIPAHLLGNMWAQQWNNILDLVEPFPGKPTVDVTDRLQELGYTAERMFEISEDFFVDLGLAATPESFWNESMIVKPDDGREVVCHASAWDFYNKEDFRIKQCTDITMQSLITVHHEMGHVQYFLQYKDQPVVYRGGANHGFHEAVGDVLALSVSTPEHLQTIGLLDVIGDDEESDLNYLMSQALKKIVFLPFGLIMDLWRWDVYAGKITPQNYNAKWWELRTKYQGIAPSVPRSEEDFDPAAKYHTNSNTPYIRYFVSYIIQFQFHKALCELAGQGDVPLHRCDIHQSQAAGAKLADMLKLGKSKPWPEAMHALTGSRQMDAQPLMDYFQPLIDWLDEENGKNGDTLGWDPTSGSQTEHPKVNLIMATVLFVLGIMIYR
ncbi:angiotensin-converting enzyme-like [Ptychodera flava]|uniref:angiotensin-converting enzyme-like n=1 Tax=Ptychodera flava TaxID=63121 RepID=UPI00396A8120